MAKTVVLNPGPATHGRANTMGALNTVYGLFSVTATLTTGPLDDLGASKIPRYSSGSTTRLLLTPAAGDTTINGLDASGVPDGFSILIVNQSATANLVFAHLASTSLSANQFSNPNASSVAIVPLGAARCTYVVNKWQFA